MQIIKRVFTMMYLLEDKVINLKLKNIISYKLILEKIGNINQ